MKKLLITVLMLLTHVCVAQVNLVLNPSFEDTVSCPMGGDELYKAEFWSGFRGTPDYFHTCCKSTNCVVGVPNNDFGSQYPHSGNAFAGMISYDLTGAPYREYLGVQLLSPTVVNQKYYLSFYINWSGKLGFTIAHNKIGCSLSSIQYSKTNPYDINNAPLAFTDSILDDSIGWSKVELSFISDSIYNFLILGNFFVDSLVDTLHLGQFNVHCYYYIDDVCLSTDSNFCKTYTSNLEELKQDKLYVFPNPANNSIQIENINSNFNITIYDVFGNLVLRKKYSSENKTINLEAISNGIYYISIKTDEKIYTKKLIIQHY